MEKLPHRGFDLVNVLIRGCFTVTARLIWAGVFAMWIGLVCSGVRAQELSQEACPRPAPGSAISEPEDLRSHDGVLKVDLTLRNFKEKGGSTRYCYLLADGNQSPTLRLSPGDLLILNLKNDLSVAESAASDANHAHMHGGKEKSADPCANDS